MCELPFACGDVFNGYIGQEHKSSNGTCPRHLSRCPLHTCACVSYVYKLRASKDISLIYVCVLQGVGRDG